MTDELEKLRKGFYVAPTTPKLILPNINGKKLRFNNGVLILENDDDIAALDAELASEDSSLKSLVRKVDINALEAESKKHQQSRGAAFSGAFSSAAMQQQSVDHRDAQMAGTVVPNASLAQEIAKTPTLNLDAPETAAEASPMTLTESVDQSKKNPFAGLKK